MNLSTFWGGAAAPYQIEQSLRFDGGARFSFTPSTTGNRRKFTWSAWIKRSRVGVTEERLFTAATGTGANPRTEFGFTAGSNVDKIISAFNPAGSTWYSSLSTALFRDASAWMHIVYTVDTEQSNSTNRAKVYINGSYLQEWSSSLPQDSDLPFNNSGSLHYLGDYAGAGSSGQNRFHGYMAEVHYLDGTYVNNADDFGEYDNNGVWRPIEVSGLTYGTNGFYLKFDPSATNGIGHDHSGNGNNWTPSGFTTSGTGTDVFSDTPTTNWCTLNPLSFGPSNADMIDGNLQFNQPTATRGNAKGTIAVSSGKWYWEVTPQTTATANVAGGILGASETDTANQPGNYATGYSYGSTGETRHNSVDATYGASYGAGDVIGTALDLDAGTLVFYKNGVSQGTAYSSLSGTFVPAIGDTSTGSSSQLVCNFGQRAFEYTPPTGFKALNTANLPAPDIADGSQNMMPVLWTGTGSARTQGGYNFQPDLLWIMKRNGSGMNVRLHDVVRGDNGTVMYRLGTNSTDGEDTDTDVTGLTSTGFTIGNDGTDHPNVSNSTYVGWGWKAAQNSGSSNTDGTIASTVSANATAGFSIGTFTGTGSPGSIGHDLDDAPKFVLIKRTNVDGNSWAVYHDALGPNKQILFNRPNSVSSDTNGFPSAPTSSVINVGSGAQMDTNQTGAHVFYAWAEVEGYSKFGSYTGNASTDGPFVYCGFRPAFVITKRTGGSDNWFIYDTARDEYNQAFRALDADTTDQEKTSATIPIDILSNGFKIRSSGTAMNGSGETIIFIAFAENPFGGSGVSPATAR